MQRQLLVISSSSAEMDHNLRAQLVTHLAPLRKSVEVWHEGMTPAGAVADDVMRRMLDRAQIILLLLSSDYLDEEHCQEHARRAFARVDAAGSNSRPAVLPVILRPCNWEHEETYRGRTPLPTRGTPVAQFPDRDQAFVDITQYIRQSILLPSPAVAAAAPAPASQPWLDPEIEKSLFHQNLSWSITEPIGRVLDGIATNLESLRREKNDQGVFKLTAYVEDTFLGRVTRDVSAPDWRLIGYRNLADPVPIHGYSYPRESRNQFPQRRAGNIEEISWLPEVGVHPRVIGGIWEPSANDWSFRGRECCLFGVRFARRAPLGRDRSAWVVLFVNYAGTDEKEAAALRRGWQEDSRIEEIVLRPRDGRRASFEHLVNAAMAYEVTHTADARFAESLPALVGIAAGLFTEGLQRQMYEAAGKGPQERAPSDAEVSESALREVLTPALRHICEVVQQSARARLREERCSADVQIYGNVRARVLSEELGGEVSYSARVIARHAIISDGAGIACQEQDAHRLPFTPRSPSPDAAPDEGGVTAWVLDQGRSVLVSDFDDECAAIARWRDKVFCKVLRDEATDEPRTRSEVVVPIVLERGELWGALNLEADVPGAFIPGDVGFLHVCGRALGSIVDDHRRRMREVRERRLLKALWATSAAVVNSPEIVRVIYEEMKADLVVIAPWGRALRVLGSPVFHPDKPKEVEYRIRQGGLTQAILSLHRDRGTPAQGLWVNVEDGRFQAGDVAVFQLRAFDTRPFPEQPQARLDGATDWYRMPPERLEQLLLERHERGGYQVNQYDRQYRTLIGLPILTRPAHVPIDEKVQREITAVMWVKNKARIPFEAVRAADLADLAGLLGVSLVPRESDPMERPG